MRAGKGKGKGGVMIKNPMMQGDEVEEDIEGGDDGGPSAAQMIAANENAMTDDELSDLTHAFAAADMNGAGVIDSGEFATMLTVMGCELTKEEVLGVMGEAKDGFSAWKRMADEENVQKCSAIWEEYDTDGSGTMNLKEITAVIAKLRELGSDPDPISSADMGDGELSFDEFMAWFLAQEGLPDDWLGGTDMNGPGFSRKKKKGVVGMGVSAILLPLNMAGKVGNMAAKGPKMLLNKSANLLGITDADTDALIAAGMDPEEAKLKALMGNRDQLLFAEFAFMMRAGTLKQFLSDDWQDRANDMCKLREAFDCADVDGNNQLELEELEMVIISMNPKVNIGPSDIRKVWDVLNPEAADWIPFEQYVKGMIKVKKDPELTAIVPVDVPNRFQLLSLLIDSPINADQEKLIFDKLTGLEKGGIKMLEQMRTPMNKAQIKETLEQACAGTLHDLTPKQRASVRSTHLWCCAQACMIGTFFSGCPGLLENYLVYKYETDGVMDAYWTCPGYSGEPFGDNNNRIAPTSDYYGGAGGGLQDYPLPACDYGLCTTLPKNISVYKAMGGTVEVGGNWTQAVDGIEGPCPLTGIPPKAVCDMYCHSVPLTFTNGKDPVRDDAIIKWWVFNTIGIVIGVVFEISLLMYTAVRSAVRVSWSLDLRLTPLNKDRAFVANMLVRAAFELGDPDGDVMGVESSKEAKHKGAERSKLKDLLSVAFIKGKVLITGVLLKQVTQQLAPYDVATWCKPYTGTMLATLLWDTMMCHVIMKNAEIRAFGVTTSVEVFNGIIDQYCPNYEASPHTMSDKCKVQILRAIGVAIVKKGSMFPTMEILLRHAVNYLGMKKSKAVCEGGIIDNEVDFIADLEAITLDERHAVLCTHMLCYVLDGSIGLSELLLWKKLVERVDEIYQLERAKFDDFTCAELRAFIIDRCPKLTKAVSRVPVSRDPNQSTEEMNELQDIATFVPRPLKAAINDPLIPQVLCQKFRNMSTSPVSVKLITACFEPEENQQFRVAFITPDEISKFTANEFIYKATNILTLQI